MQKNLLLLFKLNCDLDMNYWKENYSYDTAKDLLSMLHNELTLIDEIWVDPIFAGHTNPQGSESK